MRYFNKEESSRTPTLTPEQLLAQQMEKHGLRQVTAGWICRCGVGNHQCEASCFRCKKQRN